MANAIMLWYAIKMLPAVAFEDILGKQQADEMQRIVSNIN